MIEIVSATRLSRTQFAQKSALAHSMNRLAFDKRVSGWVFFENRRGLPEVYNTRIDVENDKEILVFMHDDVWIDDLFFADRLFDALEHFDIVGVAGCRVRQPGQPSWAFKSENLDWLPSESLSGAIAGGLHPFGVVQYFGRVPGECELLDGVLIACNKARLKKSGVRFDCSFAFHFYDLDFCRSAKSAGLRVGTWPISLTHQSGGSFRNPLWKSALDTYRKKWDESEK